MAPYFVNLDHEIQFRDLMNQKLKCSISLPQNIKVNTHSDQTMGSWCCLGNYVMSQLVGDVAFETKQSCDLQVGSFMQDQGKVGSFTQDPGDRKMWIFHLKN